MRGTDAAMTPLRTRSYRATPEPEGDSQSSSSNSPVRGDYEESDFYAGNNDSQSSIGVPAFQDMAVSEEPCLSPADRLPAEILINIFQKLSSPHDLLQCMGVSKRWAKTSVDLLWHRPTCTDWNKHSSICNTLSSPHPYFAYKDFIKRLNLASLAESVNDGSVVSLAVCTRIERLTLTGCEHITDHGLVGLLTGSHSLLALDISGTRDITEASMTVLADNCTKLQGLNISGCTKISNDSLVAVANSCKQLKRLKLNDCDQIEDNTVMSFAKGCPSILEIDLHDCRLVGDDPVSKLFTEGRALRELRLAGCEMLSDNAFLNLPTDRMYEHLRILDVTNCSRLTDRAVEKIIEVAPKLRNLVFAKCRNLTDLAVNAISRLGKNLHYLHLGHCGQITDDAVIRLVQACNRIRYIDLGCCTHLTDRSVMKLALLPKLRRIGLVKCSNITDASVYALANSRHNRVSHLPPDNFFDPQELIYPSSSLERVHLSYCTNLTLESIVVLLNNCHKLTHLSLTGVQAFLRNDLERFCRAAPPEFNDHQRSVFCVFSGSGVTDLRAHLNHPPSIGTRGRADDDDDETMTGILTAAGGPHAQLLTFGPGQFASEDDEGDEELDDGDGGAIIHRP